MKKQNSTSFSPTPFWALEHFSTAIFCGLLVISILAIVFCTVKANAENEQYAFSMQCYTQAQQAFQAEQFDTVLELLDQMIPTYQEGARAQFLRGLALLQQENYEEAEAALMQAREKNAQLVENQQYVYACGDALLHTGSYAAAQQYFLKSVQLNQSESFTQASQAALEQIAQEEGGN